MKIFDYFKRKKPVHEISNNNIETLTRCYTCGKSYDKNYNFCPHCGAKAFDIYDYLQSRGLKRYADQYCSIFVQVNDETVIKCSLLGKCNDDDVLRLLQNNGHLNGNNRNRFLDWPSAGLRIYRAACVCELDRHKIYHIHSIDDRYSHSIDDRYFIPPLYGCPNAKSTSDSVILNQMEIQVVDYGK